MNFRIFFIACLIIYTHLSHAQTSPHYSSETLQKIKAVENNLISWVRLEGSQTSNIHYRMKQLNISGAVIAVIHNYKIDWVKAYGWADTAAKKKMLVNTMFQAASIGKSVNGFGFMKLVQDSIVDLNTDINNYLKRWKFPYDSVAKGKIINIANLLSHTAGLSVHGFDGYDWNDTLPTILQTLNGQPPANNAPVRSEIEPGIRSQYSGGGIEIGEVLLEDVTHSDYNDYMKRSVFTPLKMTRTSYSTDPIDENFASGYRADGLKLQGKYMKFIERACGGAFWTTAEDLAKFVIEIQQTLKGKSNKVLTQKTASLMLHPYLDSTNASFGFFIDKRGEEYYFQHSGLNPGYSSQYYGSMENGDGVVVLVNTDLTDFAGEVVNAVATVYGWKNFLSYSTKKVMPLPSDSLKKYVGKYVFANSQTGPEISLKDGNLFLKDPNTPIQWQMYFTSANEFIMTEARWANQQFFFNANNEVEGFYILGSSYKLRVNKLQ